MLYLRELIREIEADQFIPKYVELEGVLWPEWAALFDLLDTLLSGDDRCRRTGRQAGSVPVVPVQKG